MIRRHFLAFAASLFVPLASVGPVPKRKPRYFRDVKVGESFTYAGEICTRIEPKLFYLGGQEVGSANAVRFEVQYREYRTSGFGPDCPVNYDWPIVGGLSGLTWEGKS
jgi:hypothetical protein